MEIKIESEFQSISWHKSEKKNGNKDVHFVNNIVYNNDQPNLDILDLKVKNEAIKENDISEKMKFYCQTIKPEENNQWNTCKNEIPADGCCIKREPYNICEYPYAERVWNEIPKVSNGFSNGRNRELHLSSDVQISNDIEINVKDIKKEILNVDLVPIIILQKTVFNDRNFVCDFCFSVHVSSQSLFKHKTENICRNNRQVNLNIETINKHSMSMNKKFGCDICNYKSVRFSDLKRHKIQHSSEEKRTCTKCGYKCRNETYLKSHEMSHTDEKRFKCGLCDYKSCRSRDLKIHVLSHTGEKPFKCDICDFRSYQFSSLNVHIRSHTGEKPFKCDICDYQSARSDHMKIHKTSHSVEKPLKCDLCNYKTAKSINLKLHVRSHTGEKPFKCAVCDYKCARPANLTKHRKTHKRESMQMQSM